MVSAFEGILVPSFSGDFHANFPTRMRSYALFKACWYRAFLDDFYTMRFANVSWKTLVLEVYILTSLFECLALVLKTFVVSFCECLVENARFGFLHCQFLRMSRGKRSFWIPSLSDFANVCGKRSF